MSELKLTVLVENTVQKPNLMAEHGLAMWVEVEGQRILFDTGQSGVLRHNARELGIRLGAVDKIVLSHGHYDHTGGLCSMPLSPGSRQADLAGSHSEPTGTLQVFAHPQALTDKYSRAADGSVRAIGMPLYARQALERSTKFVPTETPTEITPSVWVTGSIPTDDNVNKRRFFRDADCQLPDELIDDQAMLIKTSQGLVVLVGCTHAGIVPTLRYAGELMPELRIHAVIGGLHLSSVSDSYLASTIAALQEMDIQHFYPMHCTGFRAATRLTQDFPEQVHHCPTGTQLQF